MMFRKAAWQDAEQIKGIARRVIRHNYMSFLGAEAVSAFIDSGLSDKEIDDGFDRCTVMHADGDLIGFAIINDELLHLIMVDVPYQHLGYGSKLLAYIEEKLFLSHETIRLQSFKGNADACRFYLKNSWVITGKETVMGMDMLMFEKQNIKLRS